MTDDVHPFRIAVPDAVLADLRTRLLVADIRAAVAEWRAADER